MTATLRRMIEQIEPFDDIESEHVANVLAWIDSGAELYRISKPDNPPKHLVAYFVLLDEANNAVLLIDHVESGLWLPSGGHVEPNEHPRTTVLREAEEELSLRADFSTVFKDSPLFVTIACTVGQRQHTDVSLWFVVSGNREEQLHVDRREMNGYQWLELDEVLAIDSCRLDPSMHRFVRKMQRGV
ncbi:MAG: NUDIX hydrolase [Thermomicrobiales bacterium]|nr:NUDIX hydrolase [Thermomicrobiales bacterium]